MSVVNKQRLGARITTLDRCPVHEKLRCHETTAGRQVRLEWVFSDENGQPLDLTNDPLFTYRLRVREITGFGPRFVEVPVTADILVDGLVVSDLLPASVTSAAGIYQEEWGVYLNDVLIYTNSCYLFVNRGLFSAAVDRNEFEPGPPTIEEIRLSMRDHIAENPLLGNKEFDAAEIVQAALRPLMYWNECPPELRPPQTTITFPFREMWLLGIQSYLFEMAGHFYRRNHLPYQAGGVTIDDRNKDNPYTTIAYRLREQFEVQCRTKKIEINHQLFTGSLRSPYARFFYG
jgi:hypothetical protein